jgi:hypothetical protein
MPRRAFLVALTALICLFALPCSAQEVIKRKRKAVDLVWAEHKTKRFHLQYEQVITGDFVHRVGQELEDILDQYIKIFKATPKEPFKVQFLNNQNTFEQVGGDPSHPGFYSPGDKVLVLLQRPYYDLIPTVYHEAFHQYLHFYVGDGVEVPVWYNEGMAMYFEGMQRDEKTKAKDLDPRLIDKRKIRMVQDALFTRTHVPIEKLIDLSHTDFHEKDKESLHYHQSFAVAYFLMESSRSKLALDFAKTLKETKSAEEANAKLFGKERKNLKKVEAVWKGFVAKLEVESPASK